MELPRCEVSSGAHVVENVGTASCGIETTEPAVAHLDPSIPESDASAKERESSAEDIEAGTLAPTGPPWWKPWSVVLGSFCLTIPTYGLLSAIGLFQTYWKDHQLSDQTSANIAWIISVFSFLDCLFDAPAGILADRYGSRIILPVGSGLYIAAFVGLAFSSTYAQYFACVVVAGISAAMPTTVAFSVVSHWFPAQGRALAMGIVSTGAGFGGILFSLVLQALFGRFSWEVSILIIAGIILAFMLVGNILVETRVRETSHSSGAHTAVDLSCLRSPRFLIFCYSVLVYEFILYVQWGSIPAYAVFIGMGENQFYLQMTYNIGAILGRILAPWMSDRFFGALNTTILMNIFTALSVFVFWLPFGDRSATTLFVVVALMGLGTGSFVPLNMTCITELAVAGKEATWVGFAYTIVSLSPLTGSPVTELLLNKIGAKGLVGFLGGIICTALGTSLWVRWLSSDRQWRWRVKI